MEQGKSGKKKNGDSQKYDGFFHDCEDKYMEEDKTNRPRVCLTHIFIDCFEKFFGIQRFGQMFISAGFQAI